MLPSMGPLGRVLKQDFFTARINWSNLCFAGGESRMLAGLSCSSPTADGRS